MLSVSGLHVGSSRSAGAPRRRTAATASADANRVAAAARRYVAAIGAPAPAVRAAVMLGVLL
jgi:hypothetical protein